MGNHYNQLTLNERYQSQALHELNWSARSIAARLNRSNKTISRELKRSESDYRAYDAQQQAIECRVAARKFSVRSRSLWQQVDWLLSLKLELLLVRLLEGVCGHW